MVEEELYVRTMLWGAKALCNFFVVQDTVSSSSHSSNLNIFSVPYFLPVTFYLCRFD